MLRHELPKVEKAKPRQITITVNVASPFGGAHAFVVTSSQGSRRSAWAGFVVE